MDPALDDPLWEESILLLQANSEEEAREEAVRLGTASGVTFRAVSGERVIWEFVRVTDMHEILDESLKHGTEVFSRFLRIPGANGPEAPCEH